jgi:type VI secretion system secreted protein VgrG
VKVHFHWDRLGKLDENSSCWVRVSSAWAGKGYGNFSAPRIGQEVIVDFLEGDPDQPIIVGRVYNGDQAPPCDPGGKGGVISGLRSKTHKGSGFNEMTMDDTAGKEKVSINAQYDMITNVGHDDTQTVKNNRTVKITEGNLSEDVVAGTATSHVKGDVTETFDAKQKTTVKNDITIVSTSGPIAIAADAQHVYIKGTTNIQLRVGASMIWMDSGGQITIEGVNVNIKGSSNVTIKGGTVHSEADSQHQTKGAIVLSEGSATNTVKGGMVMLNP